jgi:alkanesulfonate monooxygenase SsuD/methylene tetrahydromethanopterin reductase-like flavin-dependent oxidoreductase (luciferase family)
MNPQRNKETLLWDIDWDSVSLLRIQSSKYMLMRCQHSLFLPLQSIVLSKTFLAYQTTRKVFIVLGVEVPLSEIVMKIGLGWRIPQFPVDGSRGQEFVAQIARSMETVESVFDSAWIEDHMLPGAPWQAPEIDALEGWTTASYLMGIFRRLSFGHIVLCNSYRNPALLAKMAATLCCLSPGRFILGLGAGWKQNEYISYGYDFPQASARIAALGEGVEIIRKMWTEDVVHFDGKYFKVNDAYCNPKPNPVPPIMIGGGGEKLLLRLVALQADWWNMCGTLEAYGHKLDVLRAHCEKVGRDYESIKKTWVGCVAIAETQDEAVRIANSNPFRQDDETTITGNPAQVSRGLIEYANLGVEYFILRFLDFPSVKGVKLFADNVAQLLVQ